jgi:archaemetzincin
LGIADCGFQAYSQIRNPQSEIRMGKADGRKNGLLGLDWLPPAFPLMGGEEEAAQPAAGRQSLEVHLIALGTTPPEWLAALAAGLRHAAGWDCARRSEVRDLSFALLASRGQFYSTAILARLEEEHARLKSWRGRPVVLGVADVDLSLPIFTFVFGEARDNGPCAVISGHRLRQEFYGLPPDRPLFEERLLKMAVHELGHTLGLRHCAGYRCVMATSYSIERLDLKSLEFCAACKAQLASP